MLFHSYEFLLGFLPLAWGVFLLLKRQGLGRAASCWLLLASLSFYGWWNPVFLLLILASIGGNYLFGRLLALDLPMRMLQLWVALSYNLGILGYFKYAGFLEHIFDQITGASHEPLAIILPLAISFYTFQQISYIVDTWRSRAPEKDFINYCLFIVFFPHLIAGPITHHSKIIPQFSTFYDRNLPLIDYAVGFSLLIIGLFKKVGIADNVGSYFVGTYDLLKHGTVLSFYESWSTMTACALQIYFDYSGYADMAAGIGLLFGVRMPLNFFSPYKATSPSEFWRRWNITLMTFLRSYVYFPLGGSRYGRLRKYFASMSVMLVCGIWHGAGWNYIVWGALVGSILIVNSLWEEFLRPNPPPPSTLRRRIGGRALAFVCYVLPLTIFMFPTLDLGWAMLRGMLGFNGFALPINLLPRLGEFGVRLQHSGVIFAAAPASKGFLMMATIAAALAVLYLCPNSEQLFAAYKPTQNNIDKKLLDESVWRPKWQPTLKWAVALGGMAAVSFMLMFQIREFFYFQF